MKSEIILDVSLHKSRKKTAGAIMDDLEVIDSQAPDVSAIASINLTKPKKNKDKEEKDLEVSADSTGDWLDAVSNFRNEPIHTTGSKSSGIFDFVDGSGGKKKKKKRKQKGELTDYRKEFEPEMILFQNLLEEQTKFTTSLQRRYNSLESTKSAARGTGKFTTDLITQINQARATTASFANSVVSIKKTIADLRMKERKELGNNQEGSEDLGSYSANFLKKMIQQDRNTLAAYGGDVVPMDSDPDDMFKHVQDNLDEAGITRPDEVEAYMKYGTDVELRVAVNRESKEYEFEAVNRTTGEIIDDYPTPTVGRLDINASTGMASDDYYNKYPIRWV